MKWLVKTLLVITSITRLQGVLLQGKVKRCEKSLVQEVLLSCAGLISLQKLLFTATPTYRNFSFFSSEGLGKRSVASKNRVNYYSFGAPMRERDFTLAGADDFRFGFQNQEMDDEIKGDGNSVNYTFRMHDPRVGRFFAIDPLTKKYPQWTPYQFGGNQVISSMELEGLEPSMDVNHKDVDVNKTYQGSDKSNTNDKSIYNWKVNVNTEGVRTWIKDGTKYAGPTPEEDASMSYDVYSSNLIENKVNHHFALGTDYKLRKKYSDPTGLKAALYSREIDGQMFYSLAYAGTEVDLASANLDDVGTDAIAGVGYMSQQLFQSISLAKRVDNWVSQQNNGNHLSFTGHSLGGGEAALASMATGRSSTTFNAMGIAPRIALQQPYGIAQKELIQAYIVLGEPLNFGLGVGQLYGANGTRHFVSPKPNTSEFARHGIDQFLNRDL